jgi:hypothetical protein
MKKIIKGLLFLAVITLGSCNSDDSKPAGSGVFTPVVYAMEGSLDAGDLKLMRNVAGNDIANPGSAEFGINYFTLNGYYDNSSPNAKAPIEEKVVEINLAFPKDNIVEGEHLFTNTLVADEYFADLNIKINGVAETVNTVSGKINILSFDVLTGQVTGTFELTTTNGITPLTHSFSGEFDYKLIE